MPITVPYRPSVSQRKKLITLCGSFFLGLIAFLFHAIPLSTAQNGKTPGIAQTTERDIVR